MTDASAPDAPLRTTPLTIWHRENGGKMVPFAGFEMPVQYRQGVLAEHASVRERVGLFDITHMGEINVDGPGAEAWLDGLVTNRVAGLAVGRIVYTAMCRPDGGVLDDMLIYRLAAERWLVVCNAINRSKIAGWLASSAPPGEVTIEDVSDATALIAVQGPDAAAVMANLDAISSCHDELAELGFYSGLVCSGLSGEWIVSRTGYTGERGYEIYLPVRDALPLWEQLLEAGREHGIAPIGLAARDTLRFEMAYCLYGHELSEQITPLEAGIGWAVKLKKKEFIGHDALAAQKRNGVPRRSIGLEVDGRAIARAGTPVLAGDVVVGEVTSGSFSPTLQRSLALALVQNPLPDGELQVEIRGRRIPAHAVACPFLTARIKGDPRAERNLPQQAGPA